MDKLELLSSYLFINTDSVLMLGVLNPLLKIPQPWVDFMFAVKLVVRGILRKLS
jgi:hypothetical protein